METHATGPAEAEQPPSIRRRGALRFWDLILVFALPLAIVFLARGCGGLPV